MIAVIRQCRVLARLHLNKTFFNNCKFNSTLSPNVYCVEELKSRGILEVVGEDASAFLQGLITNDMRHLEEGSRSMFTMFLNSKGSVMYDSIIYKIAEKLYLECDKTAVSGLQKHLKMFKLRRKVDINILHNFKVWTIFVPGFTEQLELGNRVKEIDINQETVVPCQALNYDIGIESSNKIVETLTEDDLIVSSDPRLSTLGARVVTDDKVNVEEIVKSKDISVGKSPISYRVFRYMLGVGEGVRELPHGNCFPLESNCDYLHGVSFHKGCYIGQELTARIHHTGVVRKRLMPIFLDCEASDCDIPLETPIFVPGEKVKRVGKLRGIENNTALGLLRISESLGAEKLKIGNITGYTVKPHWWPQEGPKENQMLKRE